MHVPAGTRRRIPCTGTSVAHIACTHPHCLQDFCKVAEVQFLDNLRRGASINYADLQPNPVPASVGEAYRLLSVIAPQACASCILCRVLSSLVVLREY